MCNLYLITTNQTPEMGPGFVEALPVGKFHGIGPATSAKMNSLGLYTGQDMRNQTLEFMRANFASRQGRCPRTHS